MLDARRVFDRMPSHDVVSWNSLILGYAENHEEDLALRLFSRFGCEPDAVSFVAAFKACAGLAMKEERKQAGPKLSQLERGRTIHQQAAEAGYDVEIQVTNSILNMYAKCGSMVEARRVFDRLVFQDVISWTTLILGYVENKQEELALEAFASMQFKGVAPNDRTIAAAFKACASLAASEEGKLVDGKLVKLKGLEKGMALHSQANYWHESGIYIANSLVDMYAKCGSLLDARAAFDRSAEHDTVSWNALLFGYAENGEAKLTLDLFSRMGEEGLNPDAATLVAALKACTALAAKEHGKEVNGKPVKIENLEIGMWIHSQATRSERLDTNLFLASMLVEMYSKCGSMVDARRVFEGMTRRDVVCWTSLILGYAENGQSWLSLELYSRMKTENDSSPDVGTLAAALKASANAACLEAGKQVHADICKYGIEGDQTLVNCLVDMYGKCGNMVNAQQVFFSSLSRDLAAWTSLIAGFSRQGDTERVFRWFYKMCDAGLQPDGITLICILSACSHAGLVERGKKYFHAMSSRYGISPGMEHYICLVDMLGRSNQVHAAVEVVKSMPFEGSSLVWRTVLAASCKSKDPTVGKLAFETLLGIDGGRNAAIYDLMANSIQPS